MPETGDKCADLFQLSKIMPKERTDKRREDYEFERAGEECTFKPQLLSVGLRKGSQSKSLQDIKGLLKSVDRLKRGRDDR